MENQIGIIITARVKSSRLPEKVLQTINGRRTIDILIDHVNIDKYPVILAIPEAKEDDILEQIAIDKGIECFRGYDDSPLHRLYACAEKYGFDYVVRVTADDILIDQTLLRNQIQFHLKIGYDYTFMKKCPEGVAAEIIKTSALERVIDIVNDKPTEFVSYYLKRNFNFKEYYPPFEYQHTFRLTMDYEEDLMLLRLVFASLPAGFGTLDFINFLKQHRYFLRINSLPEITVYTCNFNTAPYIVDCMKSVYNQEYDNYEFIILDDNSSDDSMDVITEYYSTLNPVQQRKTKILRNDENIGLPASCNKVLEIARGKYIIRVDSDDVLDARALEKMRQELEDHTNQGVITGYNEIDEDGNITGTVTVNKWHPAGCLLSRWAVNELKYRDNLKYLEGADFFKRFRENYSIKFIPDALWSYRKRPGQKTQDAEHPNNKAV